MTVRVKYTTQFERVKQAVSKQLGIVNENVRYVFDGNEVKDTATPGSLQMENNDQIDVVELQEGGGSDVIL